ncbi:MAG TPA: phosphoglycerate mutase family protein [Steroidobacteraceae bacterium]|jgi:broad specificity phosphatase PhoE|nr:phosphoglycerate mutase family protein [Steroidobacteraceae bacterium]
MNDSLESPPESPSLTRRRRTFLAPLWLLAMVGVFFLAMAFAYWNSATTTTIVLVRHAEKQVGAISDAPLSPQGEVRASRLGQMFGDNEPFGRIHKLYVTDSRRTQQTAAGVAQRLGLTPEVVDAKVDSTELARRVVRENRGGRALIVGHGNTVPEIVAALAHMKDVPPMGEEEYDTMYVVTVPTIGKVSVLRLKY